MPDKEHQSTTLDEDDYESEQEQVWKDEYVDSEGQTTAPTHHGPGITIQRFRCKLCGHVKERPTSLTAFDDLPPVHHNQYMLAVSEEESQLPLEQLLIRAKRRQTKAQQPKHMKTKPAKLRKKKAARKGATRKTKGKRTKRAGKRK